MDHFKCVVVYESVNLDYMGFCGSILMCLNLLT